MQFETMVPYGDGRMRISGDDYREVHAAAARVTELDRDARFLREKGVDGVVPDFRVDGEGNEYYGWRDSAGRKNVTFGQNREKGAVPLFPKGEAGYYDPEHSGPRGSRPGSDASDVPPWER